MFSRVRPVLGGSTRGGRLHRTRLRAAHDDPSSAVDDHASTPSVPGVNAGGGTGSMEPGRRWKRGHRRSLSGSLISPSET